MAPVYEKPKIIIADDADIGRAMLRALFRKQYEVIEARNGLEVIRILQSDPGTVSALLLDVMMPVMDGFKVLEFMRENELLRHIPVIALTAISDADGKIGLYEAGATDIIEKPYNEKFLLFRVGNIIDLFRTMKEQTASAAASAGNDGFLSGVLDAMPSAVYVEDPKTLRIKWCNSRFTALVGSDPVGKSVSDFLPAAEAVPLVSAREDLIVNRVQTPKLMKTVSTGRCLTIICNALTSESGEITDIVTVLTDVTRDVQYHKTLLDRIAAAAN